METPAATENLARSMLERCAAGRARQVSRVVTARFDEALRREGLTSTQITILCLLAVRGPSRNVDLQPYLAMDQSTLSRTLERMGKQGWVESMESPGRGQRLALSRAGHEKLHAAHSGWAEAQDWAERELGTDNLAGLYDIARALNPLIP